MPGFMRSAAEGSWQYQPPRAPDSCTLMMVVGKLLRAAAVLHQTHRIALILCPAHAYRSSSPRTRATSGASLAANWSSPTRHTRWAGVLLEVAAAREVRVISESQEAGKDALYAFHP